MRSLDSDGSLSIITRARTSLRVTLCVVLAGGGRASTVGVCFAGAVRLTGGTVPAGDLVTRASGINVHGAFTLDLKSACLKLSPLVDVASQFLSLLCDLNHVVAPVNFVVSTAWVINLALD